MENVVTIEVIQGDIDEGLRDNSRDCPIAIACRRAFPGRTPVVMDAFSRGNHYNHIGIYGAITVKHYEIPMAALNFINDFDSGKHVQPFSFQISEIVD